MKDVTLNVALTYDEFYHRTKKDSSGKPLRIRRNGRTQTYKRNPFRFRVPCKYGMYEHYQLTENNAHEWFVVEKEVAHG